MVIETKPKPPLDTLTTKELLESYEDALARLEGYSELVGHIEQRIFQVMDDGGATALLVANKNGEQIWTCERKDNYEPYNQVELFGLLEELNDAEKKDCHEEGHEAITWVKPKFNTQKLKSIVTKRGGEALRIFNRVAGNRKNNKSIKFARIL